MSRPTLKHAHVYISVIGTIPERREALSTLHGAAPESAAAHVESAW
jgi:hypothetical protein